VAYINQPPELRAIFQDLDLRLSKQETAQRFTAPNVASDPTNPRTGDIWYNTTLGKLRVLLAATQNIATANVDTAWTALQTFTAGLTVSSGNLTVATGSITATTGSISAGTTVTGGTGITATTGDITATTGNITSTLGTVTGVNLTSTGTTTLGTTVNFNTTSTATTVGAAGAATTPPLPVGYVIIQIAGTNRKIPFYNV
jgi:hypothetical protein